MDLLLYITIGLSAGLLSGFLGIGGGLIIVPAFVILVGMKQHLAQGTSLALMVPPITFVAALHYYKKGNVDIRVALFVCMGFVIGGLLGSYSAHYVSSEILARVFGVLLIIAGLKMIFG